MFSKEKFPIFSTVFLSLLVLLNFVANNHSDETNNAAGQAFLKEGEHKSKKISTAEIGVAKSEKYGMYITDGEGRSLYIFLADEKNQSSCYEKCAEAWPPLLTNGNPSAAASAVNADMLGTIERRDGNSQVTYNGWPLYYYAKDQGKGELTGQDVKGFGAEWYLMSPDGNYIH